MFNIFKKFKMSTKTLKLSDEKALELYKTADNTLKQLLEENWGKDFFKPKLITDIVYDIETLCDYLNISERDLFIFNKNTRDKHERYINACNILPKVAQVYNESTVLNWNNTSEYKYLPYLNFFSGSGVVLASLSWSYCLSAPSGFYYKSPNLSQTSYKNFQSFWEDFWGIK